MTFQLLSIAGGPNVTWPRPGIIILDGTGWTESVFQEAFSQLPEGTTSTTWRPYDRGIQVPRPGEWLDGRLGVMWWQQNEILKQDGAGNWVDVHTVSGQQNTLNYGVHSGLYQTIGADGRLYVCGMAPGTTSTDWWSWFVWDVEADTYSSGEMDVNALKPTRMRYLVKYKSQLYCATRGNVVALDPAAPDAFKIRNVANIHASTTNFDDKLLVLNKRLFVGADVSNRMKVYEILGGIGFEVADLGNITTDSDAGWDYCVTSKRAYFFFNSVETGTSGIRCVEFTAVDSQPGGLVVSADVSEEVMQNYADGFIDGELNTTPGTRIVTAHDKNNDPGAADPIAHVYFSTSVSWSDTLVAYRFLDRETPLVPIITTGIGLVSFFSAREGLGDHLYNDQEKVVVYNVSDASQVVDRGLRVKFWIFTNSTQTRSVRVRYAANVQTVTTAGRAIARIHSVIQGGVLNPNLVQVDNCPTDGNGGGTHEIIIDRVDTQNIDEDKPFNWYLEIF